MFSKLLIANRGEIAVRILTTAAARGYRTVAVYSEADADAPHVAMADEAVCIGPAPARDSYLNIDAILAAARQTGADAVHPGYGFLSERSDFALACEEAGLTFVGPPAAPMALMGSKRQSKDAMIAAGVPTVPGFASDATDPAAWQQAAVDIGYPVMIKASAGGGGRGMRLVHEPDQLISELERARSEAQQAFGDGELILEKAIVRPRHIEIQVFADNHGNVIHLGERDCSVQRRHQKVVEEAPSPFVDEAMRQAMGEAAVQAAKACDYRGAGTVEFIVDEARNFYFLEMNTRLQVEHPVTEAVTGLDLVALQLSIAAGQPLPLTQDEVQITGHAIEVRLYAEDPARDYLPQTGRILRWQPPAGEGVRVDSGILQGQLVTPHYDPMLAKIIASGPDRDTARRRLIRTLEDMLLLGVTHNGHFLASILAQDVFAAGDATTAFLQEQDLHSATALDPDKALAVAALLYYQRDLAGFSHSADRKGWSNSLPFPCPMQIECGDQPAVSLHLTPAGEGAVVAWGDQRHTLFANSFGNLFTESFSGGDGNGELVFSDGGLRQKCQYQFSGNTLYLLLAGHSLVFRDRTYSPAERSDGAGSGEVRASMDGAIIALPVAAGESVSRGQTLAVLEAMKMEHPLTAATDGTVTEVHVSTGTQVATGELLVTISPTDNEGAQDHA